MNKYALASRMGLLSSESAFQILAKAQALESQGKSVIHMEIGQPDFKTPQRIIDAAYRAMNEGFTGYSPTPGYPQTRNAIADYAEKYKHIKTSPDEVVVVPGAKPVMFYTMLMLVEPGDEVICPNPSFPIYESIIKFAGGKPVSLPMTSKNDFQMDIGELSGLLSPKTKLVIINNPCNPTGSVYSRENIEAVAEVLRNRPDIFILSDEIYDRLSYDGEVVSIASLPGFKDRTIILDGVSKTYSMTGWRLGYGIMNPDLAKEMELLMVNSNSCTASFTQIAAIEALSGPQGAVDEMKAAFKARRDWLVAALRDIPGIQCNMPKGAFYVFPDISSFGLSSDVFADRLLYEAGVAASSGTSFGSYGEGHIRMSYSTSMENIKAAVERMASFVKTLS